jgi:hypothetical protein
MSSGTGPPEDDSQHIVHFQRPDNRDIRRMRREYRLLCEAQAPVERVFWQLEQRKGQLADQLANEGVAPFCTPRRGGQRLRKRLTRKGGSPCRAATAANNPKGNDDSSG